MTAADKAVEELSAAEAKRELARLAKEIAEHDARYYQQDAPDDLATPTTMRCAGATRRSRRVSPIWCATTARRSASAPRRPSSSPRCATRVPMLSLGNAFAPEDVAEFFARIRRFLGLAADVPVEIVAEPKIDGLSINLLYEDGRFVPGRDARRRHRGRGRDRQPAHHRRHSRDDVRQGAAA